MFSFFRKKPPPADAAVPVAVAEPAALPEAGAGNRSGNDNGAGGWVDRLRSTPAAAAQPAPAGIVAPLAKPLADGSSSVLADATPAATSRPSPAAGPPAAPAAIDARALDETQAAPGRLGRPSGEPAATPPTAGATGIEGAAPDAAVGDTRPAAGEPVSRLERWLGRLRGDDGESLPGAPVGTTDVEANTADRHVAAQALPAAPPDIAEPLPESAESRRRWLDRLRGGLRRTGSGIAQVFTSAQIDDALYEELETALLMADAGVKATEYLLDDLKRRVRETRTTEPQAVRALLVDAIAELLDVLEKDLEVGRHTPTVMMVAGVNGAGKTTTIGKLTRHLAAAEQKVLLAAADTFRAAAREQLAVWADRNRVDIVSQQGGDPAAVTFDAVIAGKARGCDVVIADTAGRLTTQAHLMEELKKIRRVIAKAQDGAPHEVLLVVDGNTGQNALAQVQAFDAALGVTGLVVTKLDGTAKGGVLAAIAMWSRERLWAGEKRVPVYFIGVGEKLEDLQTFKAREFAQALLS